MTRSRSRLEAAPLWPIQAWLELAMRSHKGLRPLPPSKEVEEHGEALGVGSLRRRRAFTGTVSLKPERDD
jgi:hypothetical protein